MRRIKGILLCLMCFTCVACTVQGTEPEPENDEIIKMAENEEEPAPLQPSDFAVTDGENEVVLDMFYDDFAFSKPEIPMDTNFVGEVYAETGVYRYNMHAYEDLIIYTSNANYNLKDRSQYDYYISQISLKNEVFRTPRGITIGSSMEEVLQAYGMGKKYAKDGGYSILYSYNDSRLWFDIDQAGMVQDMGLNIDVYSVDRSREERMRASYKLYYGTWIITDIVSRNFVTGGNEGCEELIGKTVKYESDYFEYEGERFEDPEYITYILPMQEETRHYFPDQIDLWEILPESQYIVLVSMEIESEGKKECHATEFFLKDDNTMYCYDSGCIYKMTRESYLRDYWPEWDLKYRE